VTSTPPRALGAPVEAPVRAAGPLSAPARAQGTPRPSVAVRDRLHTPGRPPYSPRTCMRPGAQGVLVWYRTLAGREFRFTLVLAGWWGVGETGTLRVASRIGWDWYTQRTVMIPGLIP
jgi:hypothetical protein